MEVKFSPNGGTMSSLTETGRCSSPSVDKLTSSSVLYAAARDNEAEAAAAVAAAAAAAAVAAGGYSSPQKGSASLAAMSLHTTNGTRFQCSTCHKVYETKVKLQRHLKNTHEKERKFACEFCHKRFAYKHILTEHLNLHLGIKPYECEVCNKKFAAKSNLIQHKYMHKKPYQCEICHKRFDNPDIMKKHVAGHAIYHSSSTPMSSSKSPTSASRMSHALSDRESAIANEYAGFVWENHESSALTKSPVSTSENEAEARDNELNGNGLDDTVNALDAEINEALSATRERKAKAGCVLDQLLPTMMANMKGVPSTTAPKPAVAVPSSSVRRLIPRNLWEQRMKRTRLRKKSPSENGRDARCDSPTSSAGIPSLEEVLSHFESQNRLFRCRHCDVIYMERGMYFLHSALHAVENPWECSICHRILTDKNDFALHFVNQH